jgi:hypothetical protein
LLLLLLLLLLFLRRRRDLLLALPCLRYLVRVPAAAAVLASSLR